MFVDLDWPLNASSLLSASAELLVFVPTESNFIMHPWRIKLKWLVTKGILYLTRGLLKGLWLHYKKLPLLLYSADEVTYLAPLQFPYGTTIFRSFDRSSADLKWLLSFKVADHRTMQLRRKNTKIRIYCYRDTAWCNRVIWPHRDNRQFLSRVGR